MENVKFNYQCNTLCGFLIFPGLPVVSIVPIVPIVPSRQEPVQTFELNLRPFLPKTVSRCQGNCGKKITQNDGCSLKLIELHDEQAKRRGTK